MRGASVVVLVCATLAPAVASAGNNDQVNAGIDVTLTGGAVVANVYTGASLWYNPAGIARISKSSLELSGVTLTVQVVKVPGLLTIDTDPQVPSQGKTVNFTVIPEALTFMIELRPNLKLGVGLFNSSIRRTFLTEQVNTPADVTPSVTAVAGRSSRLDFFHISSGLAGKFGQKEKVLVGGAFDFVVANSRINGSSSFAYDEGTSGQVAQGEVATLTGFGLQLKAGIQWVPIPKLRVGVSVASPTFLFALVDRYARTFSQAPPAGTIDSDNPQLTTAAEAHGGRGGWFGAEPGNLRIGVAYVSSWGWVEGDFVVFWGLREPALDIDFHPVLNGRLGASFRLSKGVNLGLGAFTDFSQTHRLASSQFGSTKLDFYGVHLGFLFSNEEVDPDQQQAQKKDGIALSLAIGIRYGHGRGDTVGVLVPPQYDPSAIEVGPIATKVNEISINIGAKVGF
ncbi:MAG: hypothetical protein WAU39_01815 [Polyangiales bacterium]